MFWESITIIICVAVICECIQLCVHHICKHQNTCCCKTCEYKDRCLEVCGDEE